MGVFTPWFLGGAALVVIPWIVHQIRKPERNPLKFSSLMFVPVYKKEVLQRKKIQHWLLMLLRMLLLVLLSFAFARPYWQSSVEAAASSIALTRHVILLDNSLSMGTENWFADAKSRAEKLVAGMGAKDQVAVVTFAGTPRVIAPFAAAGEPEAGTAARARQAIETAQPTFETTAYLPAMQTAEGLLLPPRNTPIPADVRYVIHLITDFQHGGMPDATQAWKLSPRVDLDAIEVGKADALNYGVTDLVVEELKGNQLRVRGKIKHWASGLESSATAAETAKAASAGATPAPPQEEVRLVADGKTIQTQKLSIKPGNAMQVIFTMPWSGHDTVEGSLELGADALAADNKYYFAWNPRPRHPLAIVSDPMPQGEIGPGRFVQLALPNGPDLPWVVSTAAQTDLANALAGPGKPEVAVAADVDGLKGETPRLLTDFARAGGNVLLLLSQRMFADPQTAGALAALGLNAQGPRYAKPNEGVFQTLAWIDLSHTIFMPFRETRYSDFSSVHFFNFERVAVKDQGGAQAPRVLAKFEDDSPAMIELREGQGRIIVWTFGLDLGSTNMAKKTSFLPILMETLNYLTPETHPMVTHVIGEALAAPSELTGAAWQVQAPGAAAGMAANNWSDFNPAKNPGAALLAQPGYLRWKTTAQTVPAQVDAVNIDPREADPLRIPVSEFKLRLCSAAAMTAANQAKNPAQAMAGEALEKHEYGQSLIIVLLILLLLESAYAAWLAAATAAGKPGEVAEAK